MLSGLVPGRLNLPRFCEQLGTADEQQRSTLEFSTASAVTYISLTPNLNPSFFVFLAAVAVVNLALVRRLERQAIVDCYSLVL